MQHITSLCLDLGHEVIRWYVLELGWFNQYIYDSRKFIFDDRCKEICINYQTWQYMMSYEFGIRKICDVIPSKSYNFTINSPILSAGNVPWALHFSPHHMPNPRISLLHVDVNITTWWVILQWCSMTRIFLIDYIIDSWERPAYQWHFLPQIPSCNIHIWWPLI